MTKVPFVFLALDVLFRSGYTRGMDLFRNAKIFVIMGKISLLTFVVLLALIGAKTFFRNSKDEVRERIEFVKQHTENLKQQIEASESRQVVDDLDSDAPPFRTHVREMQEIRSEILAYKRAHGSFPDPRKWRAQLTEVNAQKLASSRAFAKTQHPEFMRNFALEGYRERLATYDYQLDDGTPKISYREGEKTIELNNETLTKYRQELNVAYGDYLRLNMRSGKIATIVTMNQMIRELGQYRVFCKGLPVELAGDSNFDLAFLERNCGKEFKFGIKPPLEDSWKNPLQLKFENRIPVIISLGRDGKPGGAGEDEDVKRSAATHDPRWTGWMATGDQ